MLRKTTFFDLVSRWGFWYFYLNVFSSQAEQVETGEVAGMLTAAGVPIEPPAPTKNDGSALVSLLLFFVSLIAWAGTVLDLVLDPQLFDTFFRDGDGVEIVRQGWTFVRDFLNIFFILFLLFSAFSTIFQVEQFHLKKTLLKIVIMALLVNFSWPIARVIIDMGNVMMYFFIENMFGSDNAGTSVAVALADKSGIGALITGSDSADMSLIQVGLRLIFVAALAFTLLTMAFLLLIRIIVFIILLIFSPIGFVAAILPSTQKFSTMWWDNMIKWSLMGPIMVFMMMLSLKIMSVTSIDTYADADTGFINFLTNIGATNSSNKFFANLIAQSIPVVVSIVILWSGIIAAQQMGGAAASWAVGQSKKLGNKARRGAWKGAKWSGGRVLRGKKDKKTGEYSGGLVLSSMRGLDRAVGAPVAGYKKHRKNERKRKKENEDLARAEIVSTSARRYADKRPLAERRRSGARIKSMSESKSTIYGEIEIDGEALPAGTRMRDLDDNQLRKIVQKYGNKSHARSGEREIAEAAKIALNKALKDPLKTGDSAKLEKLLKDAIKTDAK